MYSKVYWVAYPGGEPVGPVSKEQLECWVKAGQLQPGWLVCMDGQTWFWPQQVGELRNLVRTPPPPTAPPPAPPADKKEKPAVEPAVEAPVAEEAAAEKAAKERQRLYEARQRAYKSLIAAAKEAELFIDFKEEVKVKDLVIRVVDYLLGRILSGEKTPEEAVEEAKALGWASSYLDASSEAYHSLIQAAREAGLWIKKEVILADGRKLYPISKLAKEIEAGKKTAAAAVDYAFKSGWTQPLRQPTANEEPPNGDHITIGEYLRQKLAGSGGEARKK